MSVRTKLAVVVGMTEKDTVHNAVYTAIKKQVTFFSSICDLFFITNNLAYHKRLKADYPALEIIYITEKNKIKREFKLRKINKVWSPDIFTSIFLKFLLLFQKIEIMTWFQGILPEESFLKNKSQLRYIVLSIIEYIALFISDKKIFVSKSMKMHYEKKYKISFAEKEYIEIPCYSDLKILNNTEKISNSFVYVGGMAVWQCFDEIVKLYKERYSNLPGSRFFVVTMDRQSAEYSLNKFEVDSYEILSFNDREQMSNFLIKMEFGFLLREDIPVNNVASPIKFAEYLSCGINVIMNNSVRHFSEILKFHEIGNVISMDIESNKLIRADWNSILKVYKQYFDESIAVEKYRQLILQ